MEKITPVRLFLLYVHHNCNLSPFTGLAADLYNSFAMDVDMKNKDEVDDKALVGRIETNGNGRDREKDSVSIRDRDRDRERERDRDKDSKRDRERSRSRDRRDREKRETGV